MKKLAKSPLLYAVPLLLALILLYFPGTPASSPGAVALPRTGNESSCYYMVSSDHKLVVWGQESELLDDGINSGIPYLLRHKLMSNVESVVSNHSISGATVLVLSQDHKLYGIGNGPLIPVPSGSDPVLLMEHVVEADIGSHVMAVTEDGALWVWNDSQVSAPVHVMDGIRNVYVYSNSLFAISEENDLYVIYDTGDTDAAASSGNQDYEAVLLAHQVQDLRGGNESFFLLTTDGGLNLLKQTWPDVWTPEVSAALPDPSAVEVIETGTKLTAFPFDGWYVQDESGTIWLLSESGELWKRVSGDTALLAEEVGVKLTMTKAGIFFTGSGFPLPRSYRFLNPATRNGLAAAVLLAEAVIFLIRRKQRRR